jgi:RNA polymerase sigma factor (sigma-70 family)
MQRATNADRERLSREIRLALRKDRHDAEIPGCREIREGREEGWDKFYEHYIPVVTSIVRRAGTTEILGDNSSSEDIAYEVLAKFYHHSPTLLKAQDFSTDGQVVAYLKKMVENHRTDVLRRMNAKKRLAEAEQPLVDEHGQQTFTEDEVVTGYASSRSARPDSLVQLKEVVLTLCLSMESMPPRARMILKMLSEGSRPTEIARALGLGEKSMTCRIQRARESFKALLWRQFPAFCEEVL